MLFFISVVMWDELNPVLQIFIDRTARNPYENIAASRTL